jgi:N-acetylglucosaminyldiphosphoundecaprenol N-acetyl-beta-D-mannosaminyltransferase
VNRYGGKIPERITYADWMYKFLPFVSSNQWPIFFLGAKTEVLELAVSKIKTQFPELDICGYMDGYCSESDAIKSINESGAKIVITGMGMPKQEKWIRKNRKSLPNCNIFLSGGAVFDYLSGQASRAPVFLRENGFEWLYRFLLEPRRMFRRYIIGNPLFLYRVFKNITPSKLHAGRRKDEN